MLTTIPFSGFYCTLHESALDQTLEQMFSDRDTGCNVYSGLVDRAQWECHWGDVMRKYAEDYAGRFADELGIKMAFESMTSPKEYNFTTDRIFCHIPLDECKRLLAETPSDTLDKVVADTFTSRDGFISFYQPEVAAWGDISEWDYNQIGALVDAYVQHINPDFDQYAEYALMEDAMCNGHIDQWICENTPDIGRLHRVFDYLETRAERRGE